MRYYKVADGTTPNLFQIRQAHPNISIPDGGDLSELGYLPLTVTPKPADAGFSRYVEGTPALVDGAWTTTWVIQPFTAQEIKAEVVRRTQQRLDTFAQSRNYDGILSACTYATSSVTKFQVEGQYCVSARDATWASLYALLADIEAGIRTMPVSYEAIEPELPALVWPV